MAAGFFLALETSVSIDRLLPPVLVECCSKPGLAEGRRKVCPAQMPSRNIHRKRQKQTIKFLSNEHAANEPEVLRTDFENSLRAAFSLDEVQQQLDDAGLENLEVEQVSDRHMIIYGIL